MLRTLATSLGRTSRQPCSIVRGICGLADAVTDHTDAILDALSATGMTLPRIRVTAFTIG